MYKNKIWIGVIILMIIFLIIRYTLVQSFDLYNQFELISFIIDLISSLILPFLVGAFLTSLISSIPFRKKSFKNKFRTVYPISVLAILIILTYSFGYIAYLEKVKGITLHTKAMNYNQIKIPSSLRCTDVRNGQFRMKNLLIERKDSIQTQTIVSTGEKESFDVIWISDCEYHLVSKKDAKKVKVKIVNITEVDYSCYVTTDKYAIAYIVDRVGNNQK